MEATASELLLPGDEVLDVELRPIVQALRAQLAARGSIETVTPEQMRVRAAAQFVPWNSDSAPIARVENFIAADVPVRLYDPAPGEAGALLVHLHGGGWVIGDLDLEDAALRRVAARSGVRILSVDYRLAPEQPYPAPLDDAEAVWCWLLGAQTQVAVDGARVALGGASAGANIALGTALRLRDRGAHVPAFLLLMYGAYAGGADTASAALFGDGRFGLPRSAMDWFWRCYARDVASADGYAVPLRAELRGLPPVFANACGLDVLRDDTILLGDRLRGAGVPVDLRLYEGAIHGFTQYANGCALARRALDEAADALARALA